MNSLTKNGLTKGQNIIVIVCVVLSLVGGVVGLIYSKGNEVVGSTVFATGIVITFINGVYYDRANRNRGYYWTRSWNNLEE